MLEIHLNAHVVGGEFLLEAGWLSKIALRDDFILYVKFTRFFPYK